MVDTAVLKDALARAIDRRSEWIAAATADTDAVRLLVAGEGDPGVTVDRYGPILLIQTGEVPLEHREVPDELAMSVEQRLGWKLTPVWNHRAAYRREGFAHWHEPREATHDAICREEGMRFVADPRLGGLDPPLFLDLRAARRRVREIAEGRSVLNLFAYTCGVGVAAALSPAKNVTNVDFARSALDVGERNAMLNAVAGPRFVLIHEDVFPVVRQLAGLAVKGRGARRSFQRVERRAFDLVVLDPPRWAKTPFGAVDVARDYPSLLKPSMLAIAPGGALLVTNHVASVDRAAFEAVVRRTAEKTARDVASIEWIEADPDAPGTPLKVMLARLD